MLNQRKFLLLPDSSRPRQVASNFARGHGFIGIARHNGLLLSEETPPRRLESICPFFVKLQIGTVPHGSRRDGEQRTGINPATSNQLRRAVWNFVGKAAFRAQSLRLGEIYLMSILWTILIGFIARVLAKLITPGRE